MLWRRETNNTAGQYRESARPGPNTLIIDSYPNFEGVAVVLAARFAPNINPLNAERLAELAIGSAQAERTGRDGITYLMDAKRNGIVTPLSPDYEQEILRRAGAPSLADALKGIQA